MNTTINSWIKSFNSFSLFSPFVLHWPRSRYTLITPLTQLATLLSLIFSVKFYPSQLYNAVKATVALVSKKHINNPIVARLDYHRIHSYPVWLHHLCNPQDWNWVTFCLPRNCNLFTHHTFRHKSSTNMDTADFLFTPVNKPTSLFPRPFIVIMSHLFAKMTNCQ